MICASERVSQPEATLMSAFKSNTASGIGRYVRLLPRACAALALAALVGGCYSEKQQKPKVNAGAAMPAYAAAGR